MVIRTEIEFQNGDFVRIKDDPVLTGDRDGQGLVLKDNGDWIYLMTNSGIRTEVPREKVEKQ